VWLEGYLKTYNKCLIIISHSQDFLNGVCTHIIWMTHSKLTYYTGNYDTFCKTVAENEVIQAKKHAKEQDGAHTVAVCSCSPGVRSKVPSNWPLCTPHVQTSST
jgi:ATP-binding cassette subfamily F protein 2